MKDPLRVLVAGGGVAALEATLALRALAEDRVSVEVITPDTDFVYRPLAVVEPFRLGEVRRYPLHRLIQSAGAELRTGRVTSVDPDRRVLSTDDGAERAYDALLIALGAQPREAVPKALTFRGPQDVPAFEELLDAAVAGQVQRLIFALPAGVFWPLPLYELALLTGEFLTDRGTRGVEIVLVTPEEAPLALFGTQASAAVGELLELRGIVLHTRTTPVSFEGRRLRVVPDSMIDADRVVALAALEGPASHTIARASIRRTATDAFRVSKASTPQAMRRSSRSSKAESPPSRRMQPPLLSPSMPARRSARSRFARCSEACS